MGDAEPSHDPDHGPGFLAKVACKVTDESSIVQTAVRGLTNQDLLVQVLTGTSDFTAHKLALRKLDPEHLRTLAAQTKDSALALAARVKAGELGWDHVFASTGTNKQGDALKAVALINWPAPESNAVVKLCQEFVPKGTMIAEQIDLLNRFGNRDLAENYLNSGVFELERAASTWAGEHGWATLSAGQAGATHSEVVPPSDPRLNIKTPGWKLGYLFWHPQLAAWAKIPEEAVGWVILATALVFLFLPWGVGHWQDRRRASRPVKMRRVRRSPVWVGLMGAVFVFVSCAFIGTMVAWSSTGTLAGYAPPMSDPRLQGFDVLLVLTPVSLVTALVYRAIRWQIVPESAGGAASSETRDSSLPQ